MRRWSAFLFLSALAACAQQPPCEPTRTLYVVSHGWHSGIVVETQDLASRLPAFGIRNEKYLEIGWGEERYYQAREATIGMALRAVLWPRASVLQVVPFSDPPRRYFQHSEISAVRTDERGYAAVLAYIAATFKPDPAPLGPSRYGEGAFYRAEGAFHLFNNCNSWVARALDKAACRVTY